MRNAKLFEYLQTNHTLTALKWQRLTGSMSLAKRIYEIRKDQLREFLPGWITDQRIKLPSGKYVSEYSYQP